jgi:membrane-associated phospholipid phosphatase
MTDTPADVTGVTKARGAARSASSGEIPAADSPLEQADVELGTKLASNRHHPFVKAARLASKLSDQEPLYAIGAAVTLVGLGSRDGRLARTGVAMLAAVAAADGGKRAIKSAVRRTRPHVLLDEGRYAAEAGGSGKKPEQSFPSGHTACGVAAALAVSRQYPRAGAAAGAATAVFAFGRVASGAHWPLDVAAGAAIGVAAAWVSGRLLRAVGLAARPDDLVLAEIDG